MALQVHHVADQLIDAVAPLVGPIERRDASLADQLKRAAQSIVLNISEGEKLTGGNQRLRFATAAGSNAETRSAIRIAVAWGYIDRAAARDCDAVADRLAAMLWRLVNRARS